MAIARSSPLVGAISGSLASITFRNTKNGLVIASRPLKSMPQTNRQNYQRALLAAASLWWTAMTTQQKMTWKNAAATITFPNKLGIQTHPSPRALFLYKATMPTQPIGFTDWIFTSTANGLRTPPPSSLTATCSLSSGLTVTTPLTPSGLTAVVETLSLSANCTPNQACQPHSWTRVQSIYKNTDSKNYTAYATQFIASLQVGQRIGVRVFWYVGDSLPSFPRWLTLTVTA